MFTTAFTIRSDTRYLAPLRQWVAAAARMAGRSAFPRDAVPACTLALIEAVNNAIFHAHGGKRTALIGVSMMVSDHSVFLSVSDDGQGIGRHAMAHPDEMIDHGRGLFLIHRLMDKVDSRMKNGRHLLKMVYKVRGRRKGKN